jgi:hypothetical protein
MRDCEVLMSGSFRKVTLTHSVVFGSEQRKEISAISDVNFIARDCAESSHSEKKGNDTSGPFSLCFLNSQRRYR